jgi:hypothetical protein
LQLTLTPTQRAKNQFQLQGRVDMSKTNAMQGNLTLSSDSLDLTSYFDLFAGTNQTATAKNQKAPAVQVATSQAVPAPAQAATTNQLPFKNFTVEANVREFYLREIAATNFQTTVKLDGSHVLLKPFQLTLNNSPMRATADVDLSVPGYKWAVTFATTNVPFAPLWNTFEQEKGQVGGTLSAYVDMSGVGTEGESFQKSLKGTFNIGTTNLNLDVSKIRSPVLSQIVAFVAAVPELLGDNPTAAVTRLGSGLAGRVLGKYSGGLADDVSKSPIDVITARGSAGEGKVTIEQTVVRSTVFEARITNGVVTLASVLTNSPINFPIGISLSGPIGQRLGLTTDTNTGYAKMPDCLVEKGTLGDPKADINKTVIGKAMIQKLIPGLGGGGGTNGAGNLLQGIGGLLQGGANTNQTGTNQPSTNQAPINNLLNRIMK